MKESKTRRREKITVVVSILLALCFAAAFVGCLFNAIVVLTAEKYFVSPGEAAESGDYDCIVVLGAMVNPDGSLSEYLAQRVDAAAELYFAGVSDRILVSGDHLENGYDEPNAMKRVLVEKGVPEEAVFTDHAGTNTYDTMYRAGAIFRAKRVVVVTQDFHMSRSLFIARALGLEAYGATCDVGVARTNAYYELRETAARAKYVLDAIFKPDPTYLGEEIPIWGDASASDG